jgi:4-diphosphocytidyl-2-C-methyl-D-erythritol kinase
VRKEVPVAAGLGGGSADAAAALRLIQRANPDHEQAVDWYGLAARLGSDVPVCLAGRPSLIGGRGDEIVPLLDVATLAVLLVNPLTPHPDNKTARVFKALAAPALDTDPPALDLAAYADLNDRDRLLTVIRQYGNGLAGAAEAVNPAINGVLRALIALPGVEIGAVTGAGPTCFAVFADWASAAGAAKVLMAQHPTWWMMPTLLHTPPVAPIAKVEQRSASAES